jgi:hypothetical protein
MMQTIRLEVEENFVDKVKVLLQQLPENKVYIKKEDTRHKQNRFKAIALNTKDFQFNREEANER